MPQTQLTNGYNKRLFLILWTAGMVGVLSFLLVDLEALVAAFPLPEGTPPPELPPKILLKVASIIQPTILVTIAVLVGMFLAPKVGLHSPAAEAAANGSQFWPALRPQVLPGIITGILSGVFIALYWVLAKPGMPEGFAVRAEGFNKFLPVPVRIFYGGFTEEVLIRWGLMTFFVWLLWLVFQRRYVQPRAVWFVVSIFLTAIIFGVAHLPIASAISGGLTMPIAAYVVTANSIFGIVAGFLYWRFGLESAIIAHIFAHIVLIIAMLLAF